MSRDGSDGEGVADGMSVLVIRACILKRTADERVGGGATVAGMQLYIGMSTLLQYTQSCRRVAT